MRRLLLLAASAGLIACTPPRSEETAQQAPPPAPTAPIEAACNTVSPNLTRAAVVQTEAVAAAALAPELPGGPITPGVYDLQNVVLMDGAPQWSGSHFAAVEVVESDAGVAINWADITADGETSRWNASFHQGPPARVSFICGRSGESDITFSAEPNRLQLRVPDESGTGRLQLSFARRG
ncbi:MAG: hypothetical protein ABW199_09475 [Caulobacterales bacterium]